MDVKEKSGRKEQILQAAEHLFRQKGYHATSMRDLAEAMQIEAASLYSHISSKEDLLWEIASRCAQDFFATVKPVYESDLNTRPKLTEMIVKHVEVICRNLDASEVFFNEWKHLSEPQKSNYGKLRDDYENMFREVVQQGIEENQFRHYDNRFSTRAILSALNWTHTWYKPEGELKPHEIGENLAHVLLNGLIRTI